MDNARSIRERNRKRRNRQKGAAFKYLADAVLISSVIVIIVGWAVALPLLYAIAGGLLTVASATYIFFALKKMKKEESKKSPDYKGALTALIYCAVLAAVGIFTFIYALIQVL